MSESRVNSPDLKTLTRSVDVNPPDALSMSADLLCKLFRVAWLAAQPFYDDYLQFRCREHWQKPQRNRNKSKRPHIELQRRRSSHSPALSINNRMKTIGASQTDRYSVSVIPELE